MPAGLVLSEFDSMGATYRGLVREYVQQGMIRMGLGGEATLADEEFLPTGYLPPQMLARNAAPRIHENNGPHRKRGRKGPVNYAGLS